MYIRTLDHLRWRISLIPPSSGFLKNVSCRKRVGPLFMTFNIIVSHIFPENFIKFPLLCSENMKTISVNISYFQQFPSIFWIFGYFLVTKKLIFLRIALSYINKRKWWYCYWKLSFRETTYVACQSKAEKKNRVN